MGTEYGGGRPGTDTAHAGRSVVHHSQQPSRPVRAFLHWLPFLLIGSACGGTEPEEVYELTMGQAVAMFTAMHGLEANTAVFKVHESEDSIELRCPEGGGAWILGSVEVEDFDTSTEVTLDLEVVTGGCVVVTDGGEEFAVTTNPAYRNLLVVTTDFSPPSISTSGLIAGAFIWNLEDHSGECMVNLELVNDSNGIRLEYEGDLCGFDVELDLTDEYGLP